MSELLKLRDNYLYVSGDFHLDQVDIATLIDYVATSTVQSTVCICTSMFLFLFCCMHFICTIV